jgi:putative transposase
MADYRRWYVPGGTYFFTVVTYRRHPLFADPAARALLGTVMREERDKAPFETVACCLLPDHFHVLWTLPPDDDDYSGRLKNIKSEFTERWIASGGKELPVSAARRRRGRRGIWQPRFWESTIEDEEEMESDFDYIHYNPVKHGHARRPWDWLPSTFRRYVAMGHYPWNWGETEPPHLRGLDFE